MADISDLGGDGGDYARTGILVENRGLDAAKSELLGLADTGDAVAARVGAAASAGATKFSQAFVESSARSQQVLATQIGTLTQLTGGWDSASATARDSAVKLAAAIEQSGRMASATEAQVTALAEAQAVLSGAQSGATAAATQVTDATRAMTLTQIAAIEINEGLVASSGRVIDAHRSMALAQVAAIAEDEKRTNSVRSVIGAEQAAYSEEERRQAGLRSLAAAEQAAYASEAQRAAGIRQMALAQIEAIALDEKRTATLTAANSVTVGSAAANTSATSALNGHGLQLGRLNQELGTFLGRLTGTNTAVTRLGAQVGGAFAGYATTIGVLAGIAAVGGIYEKLTEDTRKQREEQEKLTKSLDDWYDKERAGPTGELESQIGAKIKQLEALRADLAGDNALGNIKENFSAGLDAITSSFDPQTAIAKFSALWAVYTAGQVAAVRKGAAEVAAAGVEAYQKTQRDILEATTKQTGQLSGLVSGGAATGGQVAELTSNLDKFRTALAALQKNYRDLSADEANATTEAAKAAIEVKKAFNLAQQSGVADNVKAAGDAIRENLLRPIKEQVTESAQAVESLNNYITANKNVLDAVTKSGDAIRTGAATNADALRQSEQAAALARTEGSAREYLAATYKAENDAIAAVATRTGIALRERLETIDAVHRESDATIRLTELQTQLGEARAIAAKNIDTTKAQLAAQLQEAQLATAATASLVHTFARDAERELSQVFATGLHSGFAAGLAGLLDTALTVVERYAPEISAKLFSHDVTTTTKNPDGTTSSVITNEPGLDAHDTKLLGAFSVAADATFKFANALNNLAGITLETAETLKQSIENRLSADVALRDATFSVAGANNPVVQQVLQANKQFDDLRNAIETAFAGKTLQPEREARLKAVDALERARTQQITDDFTGSITEQLNALKGPAGAYANQLAAINKAHEQNVTSATLLGVSLDDITKLYNAQVAAAKAAYDEGQSQLRASENAREAAAKGESYLADQITRRAAEDKELFDDSVAGYTAAELARVKYIQGLEDETAALDARNAANNALASALAQGPTGTLATQQAADLQPLTDKLAADTTNYQAALDLLASDIANGADDATIAADKYGVLTESILVSGDQANITAEKFKAAAAAMQQAQSDIQRDISLGFISKDTGRTEEANAFGFGGLSDDQIRALYTAFSGAPLTNAQEQTNKNIEQFFKDFPTVLSTVAADTVSAAQKTPSPSDAVSYAARNLSEVTGNRMADILSGTQAIERQQLQLWEKYFGFSGLSSSSSSATPSGSYAAQSIGYQSAGNRVAGQDLAALFPSTPARAPLSVVQAPASPSSTEPFRVIITHRVEPTTGKIDFSNIDDEIDAIAEKLEAALVRRANLQRYVGGSPLLVEASRR